MIDFFIYSIFLYFILILLSFLCAIYATYIDKILIRLFNKLHFVYCFEKAGITDSVKLIKLTINKENNMNKLSKIVGAVCITSMGMISSANADSSAFTGAYVGVTGSAIGMALDGTRTKTLGQAQTTKGKAGMVSAAAGLEAGFSYPLSDMAFITVGATYQPFDSEVKADNVTKTTNMTLASEDIVGVFIEPSFNITENSAFFIKVGYSESELAASGTEVINKKYDFDGSTVALGTKTIADNGMFLKTEAGITDYGDITITGIQEDEAGSKTFTSSVNADVEVAYGQVTVGFKF